MTAYRDGMGPRIDLERSADVSDSRARPGRRPVYSSPPAKTRKGSRGGSLFALLIALAALGLGLWNLWASPAPQPGEPPDPKLVITAERIAKLEKDVQYLILAVPSLEKRIKAGGSFKATEARPNKALQRRLTDLSEEIALLKLRLKRMARPGSSGNQTAATLSASGSGSSTGAGGQVASRTARVAPRRSGGGGREEEVPSIVHVVGKGETLFRIAITYKVSEQDIREWNNLRGSKIRTGQKLKIYK